MAGYWPSSSCVFMVRDGVEIQNHGKKNKRGQYLAILTEQAWSIKDILWLSGTFSLRDAAGSPERAR